MFTKQMNSTTFKFEYVVGAYETNEWVSYYNQFSLTSYSACGFVDPLLQKCLIQSLPSLDINGTGQYDLLTRKHLSVVPSNHTSMILSIRFLNHDMEEQSIFYTADRVFVEVKFSIPVSLYGEPVLVLQLNEKTHIRMQYYGQATGTKVLFSQVLTTEDYDGPLACGKGCFVYFESGTIQRTTNYLPVVPIQKDLPNRNCFNETCEILSSTTVANIPKVRRVYTNSTGVIRFDEDILIFIEFTTPIRYQGVVELFLDLPEVPIIPVFARFNKHTLLLIIILQMTVN